MKIAYIHDDQKISTGAHHINDLIVNKLRELNVQVKNVYPKVKLFDCPKISLRGVTNILFFYSLLEQKKEILKYDLIQGTTYTPLPFINSNIPVVCHFGSTTEGFLQAVPDFKDIEKDLKPVWHKLKKDEIITEFDLKTKKPLQDIADIEFFTASKAARIIATSKIVKDNLTKFGNIPGNKIRVIHNAIEDYWFEKPLASMSPAKLVFLGRVGSDVFTWKLKGMDRLIKIYQDFPELEKLTIAITINKKVGPWLNTYTSKHTCAFNYPKDKIRELINPNRGSFVLLTSRYEGFSLSLVEAMSQGLIPIAYPVGVIPEIIVNGKNGYIVTSAEEAKLRIQEVLADENLRYELSQAAYFTSLKFKAEDMAKKLVDLYEQVTKKSASDIEPVKAISKVKSKILI